MTRNLCHGIYIVYHVCFDLFVFLACRYTFFFLDKQGDKLLKELGLNQHIILLSRGARGIENIVPSHIFILVCLAPLIDRLDSLQVFL